MQIQRLYYNSVDDLIRMDEIEISLTKQVPPIQGWTVTSDPGLMMVTGPQTVRTTIYTSSSAYAEDPRTVSSIQLAGSFDQYDTSGSPYDMLWASKTLGSGQIVRFDMSNLPKNGDTV